MALFIEARSCAFAFWDFQRVDGFDDVPATAGNGFRSGFLLSSRYPFSLIRLSMACFFDETCTIVDEYDSPFSILFLISLLYMSPLAAPLDDLAQ